MAVTNFAMANYAVISNDFCQLIEVTELKYFLTSKAYLILTLGSPM